MSSRLEHHERTVLVRQTLFFVSASIALIIAFLFLILPIFIRFLAQRNLSSKLAAVDTEVPPQRPFLDQPYSATSSATIAITGSGTSNMKVILLQNGAPGPETTIKDTGEFEFPDITLDAGENTFTAVTENEKQLRSNPSNEVIISYVKDAPKLEVTEPKDGAQITQRKQNPVTVKGTTSPGNRIYVNDQMLFVAGDGSFTGSVQLSEGENTITVRAINDAQIESKTELKVRYIP